MAHVLNRKDRNQAFWKFLFFFLLSTAMIAGAMYFDVSIPTKENELLHEQISRYKTQATAQEKFVKKMEDIEGKFDLLNKPENSATTRGFYTSEINNSISDLLKLQASDSSMYSRLNKNVASVYLNYLETTNSSFSIGGLQSKLKECETNYNVLKTDYKAAKDRLDMIDGRTLGPSPN